MRTPCCLHIFECLNIYETWYVYHDSLAHINGIFHKSLQSVCLYVYHHIFARQLLGKKKTLPLLQILTQE